MKVTTSSMPLSLGRPVFPPMPPHFRQGAIRIEEEASDINAFERIFGDRDTAAAVIEIMHGAPPEIKVLFVFMCETWKMINKECNHEHTV